MTPRVYKILSVKINFIKRQQASNLYLLVVTKRFLFTDVHLYFTYLLIN